MADDSGGTWSSADSSGGGGVSLGGIGGLAQGASGAVGSLFGGSTQSGGYEKEAALYDQAAQLQDVNMAYSDESTRVQTILQQRKASQTIGAQQAAVGSAGFQESGSSLALLRDSTSQAHIASGMIGLQGAIEDANFQEKKLSYQAQAEGARAQAKAAKGGGILGALGQVAGMLGPLAGIL